MEEITEKRGFDWDGLGCFNCRFFSPYQGFNMKMIVKFFFLARKALHLA